MRGAASMAMALVLLASCNDPYEGRSLLTEAEFLVREQRYDEAIPLLRAHLLRNPGDPGAHFYLGRCYLFGPEVWLGIAAGEFETALERFKQSGGVSPIERFTDVYFEFACHMEMSKAFMFRLLFLLNNPDAFQLPPIARAAEIHMSHAGMKRAAEAMRELLPDADELNQLDEIIQETAEVVNTIPNPLEEMSEPAFGGGPEASA